MNRRERNAGRVFVLALVIVAVVAALKGLGVIQ